jgi:purine nucleosidase
MKHVILDTDIGGDPDDTFALLLALNSPEIWLDLIVTSDEHKGHRAIFARELLKELNKDVLVVRGSDLGNSKCCVIDDIVKDSTEQADFLPAIRHVVEKNPETYYVCISPETNLAAFMDYAPDLLHKLRVVIMGGALNYRKGPQVAEHNIRYDAQAARRVFYADVRKQYVISDTTFNQLLRIDKDHEFYRRIKDSKKVSGEMLARSFDSFFRQLYPSSMMHDPLTLSHVIKPGFVHFETKAIDMDEQGIMHTSEKGKPTVISASADYHGFMAFLNERLRL